MGWLVGSLVVIVSIDLLTGNVCKPGQPFLPEGVLITDSESREGQCLVIVDVDIDGDWVAVVVDDSL